MENDRQLGRRDLILIGLLMAAIGIVSTTSPHGGGQNEQGSESISGDFPSASDVKSIASGLWSDPWERAPAHWATDAHDETGMVALIRDKLAIADSQEHRERSPQLIVLPIFVNGKQDAASTQNRIDRRHAVELALVSCGYSMNYPERMTYKSVKATSFLSDHVSRKFPFVIPIKLYRRADSSYALVVWIQEEFLGSRPLHTFSRIITAIADNEQQLAAIKKHAALAIIGPSFSETLQRMMDEARDLSADEYGAATSTFFNDWTHGVLIANAVCTSHSVSNAPSISIRTLNGSESSHIPVRHFIGTDDRLTGVLKDELSRRGLRPQGRRRIALFVEQGPHQYIESLMNSFADTSRASPPVIIPYLKGIGAVNTSSDVSDYLERTLSQMRRRSDHSGTAAYNFSAVGVFGSSWQDKAAIIKSAREFFPVATFFTTELDFRYLQKDDYNVFRNLIVASHYGFGVEGDLDGIQLDAIPSFRNGYQTAAFIATSVVIKAYEQSKLAFNGIDGPTLFAPHEFQVQENLLDMWSRTDPKSGNSVALQPLLFEIGRQGPVQLVRDSLPDHFPIRQPTEKSTSFLASLVLPIAMIGLGLLFVTYMVGEYANGVKQLTTNILAMIERCVAYVHKSMSTTLRFFKNGNPHKLEDSPGHREDESLPKTTETHISIPDIRKGTAKWSSDSLNSIWLLCLVAFMVIVGVAALANDRHLAGEPLSLLDSISIWPSIVILFVVGFGCSKRIIDLYNDQIEKKQRVQVFRDGARTTVFLLFLIGVYVVATGGPGIPPARSASARLLGTVSQWFAASSLIFLACLSAVQILWARKLIAEKKKDGILGKRRGLVDLPEDLNQGYQDLVQAMESGTESSRELLVPALFTVIYGIAQFPFLDSWQMHPISYFILLLPLAFSLVAGFLMRLQARSFKSESLEMIDSHIAVLAKDTNQEPNLKLLDKYYALIGKLDRGPFGPLSTDPLLGGVLLVVTAWFTGPVGDMSFWFWLIDLVMP